MGSRKKSILRTGGAGLTERRTNSVHYPRDSKLLPILPSFSRFKTEIQGTSVAAGGGDESVGNGSGHGGAVEGGSGNESVGGLRATVNNFGSLSDDITPVPHTVVDLTDFSIVLGPGPNKYNAYYEDEAMEQKQPLRAPDQNIRIFVFRLALIEKAASALGTIAFLWATVVILGGFAGTIVLTDFLVVTVIIFAETSRIFSRSHELEWQQLSSKSSDGSGIALLGFRFRIRNALMIAFRTLRTEDISGVLYFAQIFLAVVCVGLSMWRLAVQNFAVPSSPNVTVAMNVFYVLAVLEAGLFLIEKGYWEYRIRYKKLLEEVWNEDHVRKESSEVVSQFFYDVYAESLKGSVFDGLEMDLVQYCISWLQTDDFKQQLGGARLLKNLLSTNQKLRKDRFAADALRRLGTTSGILERLVEMLSWGSKDEEELLMEVSTIICRLVVYNRNCARFVAVPGALDGLVALLTRDTRILNDDPDKCLPNRSVLLYYRSAKPYFLQLMGLRILKSLCKDQRNRLKIAETNGLLSILMLFIEVRAGNHSFEVNYEGDSDALECRLKSYKKSLQVLCLLASTTNTLGGILRRHIAAIISVCKNLRDMIQYGKEQPKLQRLAIEILNHLAMEDDVREIIGATGGIIRNLFKLFRKYGKFESSRSENETPEAKKIRQERKLASEKAGETLTRLVLQNETNCLRLLELKDERMEHEFVPVIVEALSKDEKIANSAAQILRSVLKFADDSTKTEIATKTTPVVADNIFGSSGRTKSEMYEASVGLAARTLESLDYAIYRELLQRVQKLEFVRRLIRNLYHTPTTNKYPRIRRFTLELIIVLIERDNEFLEAFEKYNLDLKQVLESTLDSTSDVENYCFFSGLVGYTRHLEDIEYLIERAIIAVENYRTAANHNRPH